VKFTFKKHPHETGLASIANPYPSTDIKLGGKICGFISPPSAFGSDKWVVYLRLFRSQENCNWYNATFKGAKFGTEGEAREWLNLNAETLQTKFQIVPED